jgi:hypothetical protein
VHVTHRQRGSRHGSSDRHRRHHRHRHARLQLRDRCEASGVPHPLTVLVDFLIGESVRTLAHKHHIAETQIEDALRGALARYDFSAATRRARSVVVKRAQR